MVREDLQEGDDNERELQTKIIKWMWNPSNVDERNMGLMITASFIFSGGNFRRLAYYWIYLVKNTLLASENLSERIATTLKNDTSVIELLRTGYDMFDHGGEFNLDEVKKGLVNALLLFEEEVGEVHNKGKIDFNVDVRTYAEVLNQDWTLQRLRPFTKNT